MATRYRIAAIMGTAFWCVSSVSPLRAQQPACERLRLVPLDRVRIVSATLVTEGKFSMPGRPRRAAPELFTQFDRLGSFCRVRAVSRPTADSKIGIEVWLPASGWNGRYLGVGNGSYGGSFNYQRLGEALNVGYAASSTDTGHRGAARDSSWAAGHREKQIDFDYRAVHETAKTAKALIEAFYSTPPKRSYFSSCSTGGRQGLMEAERYPADYDGILADADTAHSLFKALERWVEEGVPPTGVIATRFVRDGDASSGVARTRVLCPYQRRGAPLPSCRSSDAPSG